MSYDNLSSVYQNVLKFYQQLTGEERRRIPFIFDDFHFYRSRVIGLDMTENRIFTLCSMITWVVFLRMFWNFISILLVKRGWSLSFLTIFTFAVAQSRKLGIWIHRAFGPVNCEELQDRTRFYRTDKKILIFYFLNNNFILFKCHILIALNLQSQTAISTIRQQRNG